MHAATPWAFPSREDAGLHCLRQCYPSSTGGSRAIEARSATMGSKASSKSQPHAVLIGRRGSTSRRHRTASALNRSMLIAQPSAPGGHLPRVKTECTCTSGESPGSMGTIDPGPAVNEGAGREPGSFCSLSDSARGPSKILSRRRPSCRLLPAGPTPSLRGLVLGEAASLASCMAVTRP